MSTATQDATQELFRICEQLPKAKLAEVRDFALFLLNRHETAVTDANDAPDEQALLEYDVASIRQSMKEIEEGRTTDAGVFFDQLRAELLAMKAKQVGAMK